jgi:hypothetical protein
MDKCKNNSDMEDKIFDIVTDLIRDDLTKQEAIDKLLILHNVSNSTKTRADRRNKHAENVCREARFQLARHGGIVDNSKISELVLKWLTYGRKICYKPL